MADERPPRTPVGIEGESSIRPRSFEEELRAAVDLPTSDTTGRSADASVTLSDDPRHQPFTPGCVVDHFRVERLLGKGGMGVVYLARDTQLGRKVALKVVRPERLGSPAAVERFLLEARTTARFSHPNIITIHAVGEYEGFPYVALEYLEGQTLHERMREARLGLGEAIRHGLAIAEALSEAHAHGVLHRDLKPSNVLIPRDGRLRVLDFGLAKMVTPQMQGDALDSVVQDLVEYLGTDVSDDQLIRGTPSHMAPEQCRGEDSSGATDMWALGVILHEMVTGRHPYATPGSEMAALALHVCSAEPLSLEGALDGITPDLADLITRCLEKDAERRPTAGDAVAALESLLVRGGRRLTAEESPFRGLQPFGEQHARFFFGRDEEIAAFLERLRVVPVLPVLGPSGAGKSSFVHAGIVPRLREQRPWTVLSMRPGSRPFHALAALLLEGETDLRWASGTRSHDPDQVHQPVRLQTRETTREGGILGEIAGDAGAQSPDTHSETSREVTGPTASLADQLREAPQTLVLRLQEKAEQEQQQVLLFVDQLEELFSMVPDEETRRAFLQAVCTAADDPQSPVRVVFTVRDDFLGRLAVSPAVRAALSSVTVVRSPEPPALMEILTRPLAAVDYQYERPDLVAEMIAAVRGEIAALPLLQFVARSLWERRDRSRRLLLASAYVDLGGVEGALARHADGVLQGLSPVQVQVARELLLRLVTTTRGEAVEDDSRATRTGRSSPITRRIVRRAEALRGLGPEGDTVLGRLVGSRLVTVRKGRGGGEEDDASAELELVHESLIRSWGRLSRWIDQSREEIAFLAEVGQAAELWEQRGCRDLEVWHGDALHDALRTLARLGDDIPERIRRFLSAGQQREARLERRKRFVALAATACLALLAVASVLVNVRLHDKEKETQHQKAQAELREAEAWREGARGALTRGDLMEARAKLRSSLQTLDSPMSRALWWRLTRVPQRWIKDLAEAVNDGLFSPDGKTIAAVSGRSIYLLDHNTAEQRILRGHDDKVYSLAWAPDGRSLASADWSGLIRVWDLGSGEAKVLSGHENGVDAIAFHPAGAQLASVGYDGIARTWNLAGDGSATERYRSEDRTYSVAFSPDGRWLATGDRAGVVRLIDLTGGMEPRDIPGHHKGVLKVVFSPDGQQLTSASSDSTVRIWDVQTGEAVQQLGGHSRAVWDASYSPNGTRLATASSDGKLIIHELSGDTRTVFEGHTGSLYAVDFSPDGRRVLSGGADKTLRVWDPAVPPESPALGGHSSSVQGVAFSPDGTVLATGGADRQVRLWDVATGMTTGVLTGHESNVQTVAFSPDGDVLATSGGDRTIRIWDLQSRTVRRTLSDHTSGVSNVVFSPDGALLYSASTDRTIRVWDLATGAMARVIPSGGKASFGLDLSADGRLLAHTVDDRVKVFDARTGALRRTFTGHTDVIRGAMFDARGTRLVSAGEDGTVRLWNMGGGTGRIVGTAEGRVWYPDFHPDGERVGIPCTDGTATILSLDGVEARPLEGHRSEVNVLRFSPDGAQVATTSDDGTVRLWETDTGRPLWWTVALLPDPPEVLTHDGWRRLDAGEKTGPGAPLWRVEVERRARRAVPAPAGPYPYLCLEDHGGRLEVWNTRDDARVAEVDLGPLDELLATAGGCLARAGGKAWLVSPVVNEVELGDDVTALAWRDGEILLARDGAVSVKRPDPTEDLSLPVGPGVSAVQRVGGDVLVGYVDGNIEVIGSERRSPTFEGVPDSAVVSLAEGPTATLFAGFANGMLGLWDIHDGTLLDQAQLHGPVEHLLQRDGRLYAASELGDVLVLDLGAFRADYCDLLRDVWEVVPVVWQEGHPAYATHPADHACAR